MNGEWEPDNMHRNPIPQTGVAHPAKHANTLSNNVMAISQKGNEHVSKIRDKENGELHYGTCAG